MILNDSLILQSATTASALRTFRAIFIALFIYKLMHSLVNYQKNNNAGWKQFPLCPILLTSANLSLYFIPIFIQVYLETTGLYSVRYQSITEHGYLYFFTTILVMIIIQDTFFYWTHFFLHKYKALYPLHKTHHKFTKPNPFVAYSFHLGEGFLISLPYYIILLFLPWHKYSLMSFILIAIIYNGYIHSEINLPKWRNKSLTRFLYSAEHHQIHHSTATGNFGFFFLFWDKLMGTEIKP